MILNIICSFDAAVYIYIYIYIYIERERERERVRERERERDGAVRSSSSPFVGTLSLFVLYKECKNSV